MNRYDMEKKPRAVDVRTVCLGSFVILVPFHVPLDFCPRILLGASAIALCYWCYYFGLFWLDRVCAHGAHIVPLALLTFLYLSPVYDCWREHEEHPPFRTTEVVYDPGESAKVE